jgi:hypothetical protein
MSGPKVVRIVTREEIIAICQDHLAQLEAALQRWERVGRRNRLLGDADVESARKRQTELRALLAADRFTELQKQVPVEISYLQADTERRLSEAASKAASSRLYGSRLADLARQALEKCARGQKSLPEALRRELEAVVQASGRDQQRAEKALAQSLAADMAVGPTAVTPEQRALAERLRGGEQTQSLEEWLQGTLPEAHAQALKADQAIEELSLIAGEKDAAPLAARYRTILEEPAGRRRQMLLDTLMLDAVGALADAKARAEELRSLEQKAALLSSIETVEAKGLAERVSAALAGRDTVAAQALIKEVAAVVEQERKALAARAQRSAIVDALKALGYEAREGMQTAVAQDGTVIVRRAANAEMGVQVSGMHGGGRVQFRPVRFGASSSAGDTRKDRDIETIWCSDFERLKVRFHAEEGSLNVEQARPVGEVPVLFVSDSAAESDRRPDVGTPQRARSRT